MWRKKTLSPLEKRIRELDGEIARMQKNIKVISRKGELPAEAEPAPAKAAPAPIAPGSKPMPAAAAPETTATVPAPVPTPFFTTPAEEDLFSQASRPTPGEGLDERDHTVRERFANYFMAGHFQNLRPLRKDRRAMRNKALLMVGGVILLVSWLLYMFW
ncbi:MAG: hypothetical protein HY343_08895 [Lentisphaerae bacterium]|nr:hypothetical protein [Lentisphaerota bacterium]